VNPTPNPFLPREELPAFEVSYLYSYTVAKRSRQVFECRSSPVIFDIATYEAPDLSLCLPGGCTCAWLCVSHGREIPNMHMQGFKCNVAGATSIVLLAPAKAPMPCTDDSSQCVQRTKQMIARHQASGVNGFSPAR
jgi:hypothetical protein